MKILPCSNSAKWYGMYGPQICIYIYIHIHIIYVLGPINSLRRSPPKNGLGMFGPNWEADIPVGNYFKHSFLCHLFETQYRLNKIKCVQCVPWTATKSNDYFCCVSGCRCRSFTWDPPVPLVPLNQKASAIGGANWANELEILREFWRRNDRIW